MTKPKRIDIEIEDEDIIKSGTVYDIEEPIEEPRIMKKYKKITQIQEKPLTDLEKQPYNDSEDRKESYGFVQNNSPSYLLELKRLELKILENQVLLKQLDIDNNLNLMDIPTIPTVEEETKKEVSDKDIVLNTTKKEVIQQEGQFPLPVEKKGFFVRMFHKITFHKFDDSQDKNNLSSSFISDTINKSEILNTNSIYPDNIELTQNIENLKRCPLCNKKIKKSKVFQRNNSYVQIIKCKNKFCSYSKEIIIPMEKRL